jgi:hypothetical protein
LCGWWLFGIAVVAAYAANLGGIWSLIDGTCVQVTISQTFYMRNLQL